MCANYVPVTSAERLLQFFGVVRGIDEPTREVFPVGLAPFVRLAPDGTDSGELVRTIADDIFRFVLDFVAKVEWARHTYNARTETVDTKSTYRMAWAKSHRCIIPSEAFYEPNYESGVPVRWRIRKTSGEPMGIAGIYRKCGNPDSGGKEMFAFSMLTVNADDHPFMRHVSCPGRREENGRHPGARGFRGLAELSGGRSQRAILPAMAWRTGRRPDAAAKAPKEVSTSSTPEARRPNGRPVLMEGSGRLATDLRRSELVVPGLTSVSTRHRLAMWR